MVEVALDIAGALIFATASLVVLSNFISVVYPFVEPIGYVACNDENEPTLDACFFAAQNASASRDVAGRKLDATEWPT